MARTVDPQSIIGLRFGRILVTGFAGRRVRGRMWFSCKCDCGKEWDVPYQPLRSGRTKSCGCLSRDTTIARNTTHGMADSPEYSTWKAMICRCYNKNHDDYYCYGGRGIFVCDRWRHSFVAFHEDMGDRPTKRFTMIERIDNSRGYEPGNCKWAEYEEQARNRRNNRIVEYAGQQWVFAALCEHCKIGRSTAMNRLRLGWTLHDAFTIPVGMLHRYTERIFR